MAHERRDPMTVVLQETDPCRRKARRETSGEIKGAFNSINQKPGGWEDGRNWRKNKESIHIEKAEGKIKEHGMLSEQDRRENDGREQG